MDFWNLHPGTAWWLIVGFAVFPRITMLLAMATPFGWVAWLGWIFVPSVVVAVYATQMYWGTNPDLVIAAWVVAALKYLGGGAKASSSSKD
jgi:hypothetical protein